ncbi:MAG: VTC domain-containing protein [Anaerolineaceae bacterium]|nr:VTC domain-containing protein [Anaerolineaceae bacterium]
METKPKSYRYERKSLVEGLDAQQVRMLVRRHPGMFYEPYPPRFVNNLYLDSEDLRNYEDNLSGAEERHKARIRWYGDLFGEIQNPVLEFKVKKGLVGTKYAFPLPVFRFDQDFTHSKLQRLIQTAELPDRTKFYLRNLHVSLCNRYYRWYYATRDHRFRITIDTGMAYYRIKRDHNQFTHKYVDHNHVVVELKYDQPLDVEADRIAGFFPFGLNRNSKYVTGIETVFL